MRKVEPHAEPCTFHPSCKVRATVRVSAEEIYCRAHAVRVADREARTFVMERDRRTCQRCGKPATDTAHLVGRGARYIRWEPQNLVALCRSCHRWLDEHPAAKSAWVADTFGPVRYDRLLALEARGERQGGSVDFAAVIRGFREQGLTLEEMARWRSGAWLG